MDGAVNLLVNGSFETIEVGAGAFRAVEASDVEGWGTINGTQIEAWDSGHAGTPSSDGERHIEIDHLGAGPTDGIYQDVQTQAGETYTLMFDIQGRGSLDGEDNRLIVEWNGVSVEIDGFTPPTAFSWTTVAVQVTGTGGLDRLTFRESEAAGGSTGFGPLLDHVRLFEGVVDLPEPEVPPFTTETIVAGLDQPIAFVEAPDGRIFVTEKAGRVKVIENGQIVSEFIDINEEVNSHHDRGLMGIALDPEFETNGHVYLQYVVEINPENPDEPNFNSAASGRLIRITASEDNPNVADLSTRVVIQDGHEMSHATHAVGDVDFDNDGNLIYTWGDGGFRNDLRLASQDPDSVQGKLFRIDRETFEGIEDNPYYDPTDPGGTASRVWATGVRNSWKITVDRETGDVYMGEVTDGGPEEINVMRADGSTLPNYGWPYYQGDNQTGHNPNPPIDFVYQSAFIELPHTNAGGGDSILGGAVYRGDTYPDFYDGRYFFANVNQGIIYTADQSGNYEEFGEPGAYRGVVDIQMGSDGNLWMLNLYTGELSRIVSQGEPTQPNADPVADGVASRTAGLNMIDVRFDATESSDADGDDLSFAWDFDGDGVTDATGAIVENTFTTPGRNDVTLTVTDGNGGSDTKTFEVDVVSDASQGANLALGRPTTQSGTADGGLASRAVDGNTAPDFTAASVSKTVVTRTPLWEVDLGGIQDIGQIRVHTETGAAISNYWILVSDVPFNSGNLSAALTDPGVWSFHNPGTAGAIENLNTDEGVTGRYVRIQLESQDASISLAEVEIFLPTPTEELLVNGSFEALSVRDGGWVHVDDSEVAGWKSLNGERLEFWDSGHSGVTASDGETLAELDYNRAGEIDGIYQDVETIAGEVYTLTFDMRARRSDAASGSETLYVEWNGQLLQADGFNADSNASWTSVSVTVVGTGGTDRIVFREGASDGFGPLIDNVSLKGRADNGPTPEPVNLLTNGSFESVSVADNRWTNVDPGTVDGWTSLNGERLEFWDSGHNGTEASDGETLMEIDYRRAGEVDGISQEINTVEDQVYTLAFDMQARRGDRDGESETLYVEWNGLLIRAEGYKGQQDGEWTTFYAEVTGTGGVDELVFRESTVAGASDGNGPLLDNVGLFAGTYDDLFV